MSSKSPAVTRIVGDGVVLRAWETADVPALVDLYDTAEMDLRTPVPSPFTVDVASGYVEAARRWMAQGALQFAITEDGRAAVGEVLASPPEDGVTEMAYAVAAGHRGRGLASRAVSAVLASFAGSDVRRALLLVSPDNLPSQKVAQSAGFTLADLPEVERRRKGRTVRLRTWERTL